MRICRNYVTKIVLPYYYAYYKFPDTFEPIIIMLHDTINGIATTQW